ncbi:MAG: radical SAM protein [bacterium]|nr:radical SAM protein [bacterium]
MKNYRVLLINPPDTELSGFNGPPLSLLYLAGTLKKKKIQVKVIDGFFCGWKGVNEEIKKYKPTIVGVSCLTIHRFESFKVLKIAKQINPKILTVIGGAHSTIMHTQIIDNYPYIDIVVRGEGEQVLLEIARGESLKKIKGITYRQDDKAVVNPPQRYVENLDQIPFPAWEMVDLKKYPALPSFVRFHNGIDTNIHPRISVVFTRGCPGHCNFCSTWSIWRGWRGRSGKNMADEIELLYKKYGTRHFMFCDDCMTVRKDEVINLCNEIIKRKLKIAFTATTRTDSINLTLLKKLKEAGCYVVHYGIESASPKVLKLMDKENTLENSEKAIALTKKVGLKVVALMITGAVGETINTLNQSIRFLQKNKPDFIITYSGLFIYPGTKVFYYLKSRGKIDDSYWLKSNPPKIYTETFSETQLRYFRINVERRTLINQHNKVWRSLPFLTFFYIEKFYKGNKTMKDLTMIFYPAINRLIQTITNGNPKKVSA